MVRTTRALLGQAIAAAAASALTIDIYPPSNPRFREQPWRDHEPMAWRGRKTKRPNPNRDAQAAAKRARKITRRSRP